MIIRQAHPEDAPAMARFGIDTFLTAHKGQISEEALRKRKEEWSQEESERNWHRTLREISDGISPRSCVYIALDQSGEVIGIAMGCPTEAAAHVGEIVSIYVRTSHQRQGIGRRLVQAVAIHLAQHGMTALQIGALRANAPARRFYESLGGRVIGERTYEEGGVLEPGLVYGWTDIADFRS